MPGCSGMMWFIWGSNKRGGKEAPSCCRSRGKVVKGIADRISGDHPVRPELELLFLAALGRWTGAGQVGSLAWHNEGGVCLHGCFEKSRRNQHERLEKGAGPEDRRHIGGLQGRKGWCFSLGLLHLRYVLSPTLLCQTFFVLTGLSLEVCWRNHMAGRRGTLLRS